MSLATRIVNLFTKIPTQVWLAVLVPAVSFASVQGQRLIDSWAYPEIDKSRIKALEGSWEGNGIQNVPDEDTKDRLIKKYQIEVSDKVDSTLLDAYNDCVFKREKELGYVTSYPAHLKLQVKNTTVFSKKDLEGTLEVTPQMINGIKHDSLIYSVKGKLERNGEYIRLDYTILDPSKKDFGTLLLEYNGEGKLCGKFLSYGPISRSIVSGIYMFYKAKG